MKIYNQDYYTGQIIDIIKDIIKSAKDHPYEIHYLIVDDPLYYEEGLLKYSDTLFNIEIMTWNHWLNHFIDHYHLFDVKQASKIDVINAIVGYLKNHPDNLFFKSNDLYATALQIYDICLDIYLNNIEKSTYDFTELSQYKIDSLFDIYYDLQKTIAYPFGIIDEICLHFDKTLHTHHYYCLTRKIENKKSLVMVNQLDHYSHLYLFQDIDMKDRSMNHLCDYLFSSEEYHIQDRHPYHIIKANHPYLEVDQVLFLISTMIYQNQLHYQDFAIYYPNQEYLQLIIQRCQQLHIRCFYHETLAFPSFESLLYLCQYLIDNDEKNLLYMIDLSRINAFQDFQNQSYLKKEYAQYQTISHPLYQQLKNDIDAIQDQVRQDKLSQQFINLISSYFIRDEESLLLINQLQNLNAPYSMSFQEYVQLLKQVITYPSTDHHTIDSVYLLDYTKPYSQLLQCRHVFMLGFNETIVPQEFKNTKLILNHEAKALGLKTTIDDLNLHQRQLTDVFSNNHESIYLSYSLQDMSGSDCVVSSLLQKIKDIFSIKEETLLPYHPKMKEYIYLDHFKDESDVSLNQRIMVYETSKNQVPHLDHQIDHNPLSASKLEVYNSCPFRYFNQYLLKIRPFETSQLQPNDMGTLVHYVLEKNIAYYKDNHIHEYLHLKQDIHQTIQTYLKDHLTCKQHQSINQFLLSLIEHDLYNTIIILSKQMEAGLFENKYCEKQFEQQINQMTIKGMIDRVDTYKDYMKVIDYKSSSKDLDLNLARQGFNMQMLLYLDILSQQENMKKGAVLYFNTKKRLLKSEYLQLTGDDVLSEYRMEGYTVGEMIHHIDYDFEGKSQIIKVQYKKDGTPNRYSKVLNRQDFDELLKDISKHIASLYQQMLSGTIDIYPSRSDNPTIDMHINPCRYCPYKSICHFDLFYNEEHLIEKGE